jgi:hypothetical protein
VREHERLEAALHALGDAGSRATRAVTGRGRGTRAPSRSARPSSSSRKRASAAARSSRQPAAPGRAATVGAESSATAPTRRRSGATSGGRCQPTRRSATGPAASTGTKKTRAAGATSPAPPVRKRAARGANREAVLRVIGARPGVSARELAAASEVTGGTLYALLRKPHAGRDARDTRATRSTDRLRDRGERGPRRPRRRNRAGRHDEPTGRRRAVRAILRRRHVAHVGLPSAWIATAFQVWSTAAPHGRRILVAVQAVARGNVA